MKRLSIVVVFVLLSGCVSIPLSTIWRLSQLTSDDITNLDPSELGVAVDLPDTLLLDSNRTVLRIDLFRKAENGGEDVLLLTESAHLTTVETGRHVIAPLRAASKGRHWQVMRLDSKAQESFRRFQKGFDELWSPDDGKYFSLVVNPRFLNETGVHDITVALQLDGTDGWFLLLDDAEMDFEYLHRAREKAEGMMK